MRPRLSFQNTWAWINPATGRLCWAPYGWIPLVQISVDFDEQISLSIYLLGFGMHLWLESSSGGETLTP